MEYIHMPGVASGLRSSSIADKFVDLTFDELCIEKSRNEKEILALSHVLGSHGVKMSTSLTTFDGYPRADLDVPQIRMTRARIIYLKNELQTIRPLIAASVEQQFAQIKAQQHQQHLQSQPPLSPTSSTTSANARPGATPAIAATPAIKITTLPHHPAPLLPSSQQSAPSPQQASSATGSRPGSGPKSPADVPFAKVDQVSPNSPAARAGLQTGDLILRFGTVNRANHDKLRKLAEVVSQHAEQQTELAVLVLRADNERASLGLAPRNWGGKGLLGCHILPF